MTRDAPPFPAFEQAEAQAWAEIQTHASREFRDRFRVCVHNVRGATLLTAPSSDLLALNRLWLPGSLPEVQVDLVDEVVARSRAAGVKRLMVHCPPSALPPGLSQAFAERGFVRGRPMTKLYRSALARIEHESSLTIERIEKADVEVFGRIAALGNDAPPFMADGFNSTVGHAGWHHYLALDNGAPIAAAAFRARAGVAWCCFAGTLPEHRRRGAQTALLARRIQDAATAGCQWLTCEAMAETTEFPSPSLRNMMRSGFAVAYERHTFLLDLAPPDRPPSSA